MKIVIIGDGKVGYKLAKQLSEDNYDVVLIDNNAGKLKAAINKLDIICITGACISCMRISFRSWRANLLLMVCPIVKKSCSLSCGLV